MNKKILKEQSGMAAIMFAMFIVIVVSLIAFGFAVLVRNDQRQTLDKTLSNQAIYAAETAINKKQRDLAAGVGVATNDDNCTEDSITGQLDAQIPGVTVTCLTWNKTPDNITFQNVGNSPYVTRIEGTANINSLQIAWTKSGSVSFGGNSTQLELHTMPTLRITIADESDVNNAKTIFINPRGGGGSISMDSTSGIIGDSRSCSGNSCMAVINGLPNHWNAGFSGSRGWISVSSLNGVSSTVTITAHAGNNGPPSSSVSIVGAQAEIDATAKSQDVIKRLKARVSLTENTWRPGFAAMAEELCKNYAVNATGNDNTYSGMVRSGHSTDLCPDTSP